uniref:protein kinase domain-containing protein n=1 Tax=Salmonella sp. s51228 TaxID=3159652 RepID=UPI00398068EF
GRVGSLYWMAPEIYKKQFYNEKCDIWSFGIAILEMLTGDPPYYASRISKEEVVNKLTQGIIPIPKDIPHNMSSFIKKCLKENPEERWTAKELLAHPFLQESVSLKYLIPAVKKCLTPVVIQETE